MFTVTVKTLDGQDSVFELENEDMKIEEFKKDIESRLNISAQQQRLIFQGRVLRDDQTLAQCGVQNKVIHLVARPPPSLINATSNADQQPSSQTTNSDPIFSGMGPFGTLMIPIEDEHRFPGLPLLRELVRTSMSLYPDIHMSNAPTDGSVQTTLRETTFRRLLGMASEIVRDLAHNSTSGTSDIPGSVVTQDQGNATTLEGSDSQTPQKDCSSTVPRPCDTHSDETGPSNEPSVGPNSDLGSTQSGAPNADSHSISPTLANMFEQYRQLWQSAQPYLNEWQSLMISEHRNNQGATTGESVTESGQDSGSSETNRPQQQAITQSQQRFNQISRLLHINAHLLHIMSDFVSPTQVSDAVHATTTATETRSTTQHSPMDTSQAPEPSAHSTGAPNQGATRSQVHNSVLIPGRPHFSMSTQSTPVRFTASQPTSDPEVTTITSSTRFTFTTSTNSAGAPGTNVSISGERAAIPVVSMMMPLIVPSTAAPTIIPGPTTEPTSAPPPTSTTTPQSTHTTSAGAAGGAPVFLFRSPMAPSLANRIWDRCLPCLSHHLGDDRTHPAFSLRHTSAHPVASVNVSTNLMSPLLTADPTMLGRHTTGQTTNPPASSTPSSDQTGHGAPTETVSSGTGSTTTTTTTTTNASTDSTTPSVEVIGTSFGSFTLQFPMGTLLNSVASSAAANILRLPPFNMYMNLNMDPSQQSTGVHSTRATTRRASTTSATTTNTQQDSASAASSVSQPKPSWAIDPNSSDMSLTDSYRIFNVLAEGLVRTVWARISRLASLPDTPQINFNQLDTTDLASSTRRISVGFLTDIFDLFRTCLLSTSQQHQTLSGDSGSRPDQPVSRFDNSRQRLQHLLNCAQSCSNRDFAQLASDLAAVIFDGFTTDTQFGLPNAGLRDLLHRNNRHQIVDVTASFLKLCQHILTFQLDLWRTNPTNTGFGNTLQMTLELAFGDLLQFTYILTDAFQSAAGLHPIGSETDPNLAGDFTLLSKHLDSYLNELQNNGEDLSLCQTVIAAMKRLIESFRPDRNSHQAGQLQSFIVHRDLNSIPPAIVPHNEQPCELDDPNGDDLAFVDARSNVASDAESETRPSVHSVPQFLAAQQQPVASQNGIRLDPEFRFSLPESIPKPVPWTRALDPHPQALADVQHLDQSVPSHSPDWASIVPPNWVGIISRDIENMLQANGAAAEQPNGLRPLNGFSDGYVAGMPAKRRKIMQENARTSFNSPEVVLNDCLTEAIQRARTAAAAGSLNGIGRDGHHSGSSTHADSLSSPESVSNASSAITSPNSLPQPDRKLVSTLQDIITEQISSRLASDPDFDPAKFPLSSQKFIKPSDPKP